MWGKCVFLFRSTGTQQADIVLYSVRDAPRFHPLYCRRGNDNVAFAADGKQRELGALDVLYKHDKLWVEWRGQKSRKGGDNRLFLSN